jgi:hypothetical protein
MKSVEGAELDGTDVSDRDHDAMIRWQGYAREQRSTVNSLFLTYAAALVGLQSSILLTQAIAEVAWSRIFLAAGCGSFISLTAGCIVVLLRLRDARLTARLARYRVEKQTASKIKRLRLSVENYGRWTNRLIPVQVAAFALAVVAFVIWLVLSFRAKLSLGG